MAAPRRCQRPSAKVIGAITLSALLVATLEIVSPVRALPLPVLSRFVTAQTAGAAAPAEHVSVKEGVVIVGGGPSGMATALMLAKRGWTDISVIEKSPSADFYNPSVAFV